jgi:hypothetical protein
MVACFHCSSIRHETRLTTKLHGVTPQKTVLLFIMVFHRQKIVIPRVCGMCYKDERCQGSHNVRIKVIIFKQCVYDSKIIVISLIRRLSQGLMVLLSEGHLSWRRLKFQRTPGLYSALYRGRSWGETLLPREVAAISVAVIRPSWPRLFHSQHITPIHVDTQFHQNYNPRKKIDKVNSPLGLRKVVPHHEVGPLEFA